MKRVIAISLLLCGMLLNGQQINYDTQIKNKPTIPAASTTTPAMDGSASYGSGTTYARADHVHPTDTGRAAANASTTVNGAACALGSTCTVADATKVPTSRTVAGKPLSGDIIIACADISDAGAGCAAALASTNPAMDGTAAPGVGTTLARADHVHPTDTGRAAANASTTVNGAACALGSTCTVADATKEPIPATATNGNFASFDASKYVIDSGKKPADFALAGASTTVNGVACALGSTCTVADATKVPTTRTVAGKALSADVGIACADLSDDGAGCTAALASTNPAMDGTAAPGVGTTLARADHVHPTDTGRAASNAATTVNGQSCVLSGTCTVTAMPSLVCKVTSAAQSTALASPATACTFALASGATYGLMCNGMTTNASASNLPTVKVNYGGTSSASNFQGQMYSTATADTVGNAAAGSTVVTSAATAYTAMPLRINGYITTTSASNLTVVITSSGSYNSSIIAGTVCMVF